MRIRTPKIIFDQEQASYTVEIETSTGRKKLWYRVSSSHAHFISELSDAAVVGMLIPAMLVGEDVFVEGEVSGRLLLQLSGPYQKLLTQIMPSLRPVKIFAEQANPLERKYPSGVATGFSGGIDSYCLLADHYYNSVVSETRVSHLLFNNVGSHGRGKAGEELFRKRYSQLLPTVEKVGLPFLMINSNLDSFYPDSMDFELTHTLRNAAVALLLQKGISYFMYASAFPYTDIFVGSARSMAYSDAVSLPMLSTASLAMNSVGGEYTRVEKTLRVCEITDSYDSLDVCVNPNNLTGYTNCAECWKCLRTLVTLDMAGRLECYAPSFNLSVYEDRKQTYLASLRENAGPLEREILQFAKDRHFAMPA